MDSVTSAVSALSIISKPKNGNGKIVWPGGPAKKQYFSISEKILYYMARNPKSPETYLKHVKICKYFFEKLPLLVVERIHGGGKKLCSNKKEIECRNKNRKCCVNVDLSKITKSKIWLNGILCLTGAYDPNPNLVSTLLPKIYESQDAFIMLDFYSMNMEEFKLWGKTFTKFHIGDKSISIDAKRNRVMIDSMLEAIANVKEFQYSFGRANRAATSEAMKNVLKLKNLDKLESLFFIDPPEIFAVKDYSAFMKAYKNTKFRLNFLRMSEQYKIQIDALIDDIIVSKSSKHLIEYRGQDKEKLQIMKVRFFD